MTFADQTQLVSDLLFQPSSFENAANTTITPPPASEPAASASTSKTINEREAERNRSAFEAFAESLRDELHAGSLLETVLVERVILAAWRLQVASDQDVDRIMFKDKLGPITPEILRAECSLETAFSLLETARRVARPGWQRTADVDSDRNDGAPVDPFDSDLNAEPTDADFANEWPILNADSNPRDAFRDINREPFDDQDIEDEAISEPEPTRWQDRLVFDHNVSETSPVVKGTWITVSQVVSLIVDGYQWSDILRDHPELTEEDIRTCLAYTVAQDDFGQI